MEQHLILVLGGARSGKSRYAEAQITGLPSPWTYIATAEVRDDEMLERVTQHKQRRDSAWVTVEAPLDLVGALRAAHTNPVLVDCLTMWLSNLVLTDQSIPQKRQDLIDALKARQLAGRKTILVGSEVGLGIVPDNALARRFRDEAGLLHQEISAIADRLVMTVAGYPITIKG